MSLEVMRRKRENRSNGAEILNGQIHILTKGNEEKEKDGVEKEFFFSRQLVACE